VAASSVTAVGRSRNRRGPRSTSSTPLRSHAVEMGQVARVDDAVGYGAGQWCTGAPVCACSA
jgi:hypothetical protein